MISEVPELYTNDDEPLLFTVKKSDDAGVVTAVDVSSASAITAGLYDMDGTSLLTPISCEDTGEADWATGVIEVPFAKSAKSAITAKRGYVEIKVTIGSVITVWGNAAVSRVSIIQGNQ